MNSISKVILLSATIGLGACTALETDKVDYRSAAKAPRLDVPPDLTQLNKDTPYTVVGGVFAALVFSTSVVSIPMILDRDTDALTAGITSMRVVLENPLVMLLWGALITGIIVLAMLPMFLGLLIAGPVIGHATWHAYRHIVPAA